MRYVLLTLLCLCSLSVCAQSDWEQAVRDWLIVDDVDGTDAEEAMALLADFAANKLDLNHATRTDLEQFPFLSAQQIEGIVEYLDRYRPVRSLSELQMITSLDRDTRQLLKNFVFVGYEDKAPDSHPTFSLLERYGRFAAMATLNVPLYERKGDSNGYLGYKYRHDVRLQYSCLQFLKVGLTAAQDAGEPFFANRNTWGYDHYSYYFQLRGIGHIEELNLGMYRVQMGMGLVMNTGFQLGKLAVLQSLGRSTHVLTAHSSRSADGYLRGAAATVRLSDAFRLTAFASHRPLDATLNDDGTVRTISASSYHRTPTELARKHNTNVADLGLRISFRPSAHWGRSYLNLNVVYTHFDRPLVPPVVTYPYRYYDLAGSSFFNASADYGFTNSRLSLSGETAVNADGALAALHVLSLRATGQLSLMALHRYYDRRYTAFRARSFSEGSSVQNEHGLYVGLQWSPSRNVQVQGYADYAYFPWKRYLISTSSEAFDALLQVHVKRRRCDVEGRYRFHLRQRDNANKTLLQNRYEHRARLRFTVPILSSEAQFSPIPSRFWTLQFQADGVVAACPTTSRGLMLGTQTTWQHRWLQLNAYFGWFRTDDYDSRLYQYERSVRYDFSFPAYDGHGIRYSLMARASIGRFVLSAKFSVTDYFDRSSISSGLQQISASSQPSLLTQLSYRL